MFIKVFKSVETPFRVNTLSYFLDVIGFMAAQ